MLNEVISLTPATLVPVPTCPLAMLLIYMVNILHFLRKLKLATWYDTIDADSLRCAFGSEAELAGEKRALVEFKGYPCKNTSSTIGVRVRMRDRCVA